MSKNKNGVSKTKRRSVGSEFVDVFAQCVCFLRICVRVRVGVSECSEETTNKKLIQDGINISEIVYYYCNMN